MIEFYFLEKGKLFFDCNGMLKCPEDNENGQPMLFLKGNAYIEDHHSEDKENG